MSRLLQADSFSSASSAPRRQFIVALGAVMLGNLIAGGSYVLGWLTLNELLWTYWLQSVAIGFFNFRRMMSLKQFSTRGLRYNDQPVPETPEGKCKTARFFLLHYGMFHVFYAVFLFSETAADGWFWVWIIGAGVSFVIGERAAFWRHVELDAQWTPNLGTMMFRPYLRVVPMHLAILSSGAGLGAGVFLSLKVAADIGMFIIDEVLDTKRLRETAHRQAANSERISYI